MMQGLGFPPAPFFFFLFSFPNRGGAEQCCKEDAGRMKESDRMQNSQKVTVVFAERRETAKEMTGKAHC